jgi:hypothetical protein
LELIRAELRGSKTCKFLKGRIECRKRIKTTVICNTGNSYIFHSGVVQHFLCFLNPVRINEIVEITGELFIYNLGNDMWGKGKIFSQLA